MSAILDNSNGEPPKRCYACGQKIRKLNPHRMDRQKVAVLETLGKAMVGRQSENGWMFVERGHTMRAGGPDGQAIRAPYCALEHAIRMTWFGLVERGEFRSGLYRITPKGLRFLIGRERVPEVIYCKEGQVIEASDAMVHISDVRRVVLDKEYWDHYASEQKPDTRFWWDQ